MNKRQKLQKLLKAFNPDKTLPDFSVFDEQIKQLKNNLKDKVTIKTLEEVNLQLEKFKKRIDLEPILTSLSEVESSFKETIGNLYEELDSKMTELNTADEKRSERLKYDVNDLQSQITELETSFKSDVKRIKKSIPDLTDLEDRVSELTIDLETRLAILENVEPQEIKDWTDTIEKLRRELMNRINHIGGGAMNRKVTFGGVDYLTRYTDINYKAGNNVTFTVVNNNTTKMVDVTISSTGGGAGTVRSINSISSSQAAGSTSGTDYVYLCSGTMTLTMPDATAGNTNLYTVKNVGTGVITINTVSAQTIDNDPTIIMPVRYTSVDLISDTANWSVT